jgi:hypothetical protein
MSTYVFVKYPVIVAAVAGFSIAQASTLTRADYNAEKARIEDEYKAGDSRCGVLAGNAKDNCVQEAKFSEKVALANLEYRFTGDKSDERKYVAVKGEADYAVAKEKCSVTTGKDKDLCMQKASLARANSLPDAKTSQEVGKSHMVTAKRAQGPDYEVAVKRCDQFDGDTKSACIISVKAKFGKS